MSAPVGGFIQEKPRTFPFGDLNLVTETNIPDVLPIDAKQPDGKNSDSRPWPGLQNSAGRLGRLWLNRRLWLSLRLRSVIRVHPEHYCHEQRHC